MIKFGSIKNWNTTSNGLKTNQMKGGLLSTLHSLRTLTFNFTLIKLKNIIKTNYCEKKVFLLRVPYQLMIKLTVTRQQSVIDSRERRHSRSPRGDDDDDDNEIRAHSIRNRHEKQAKQNVAPPDPTRRNRGSPSMAATGRSASWDSACNIIRVPFSFPLFFLAPLISRPISIHRRIRVFL